MKRYYYHLLILALCCSQKTLGTISLVYNLRVAEATKIRFRHTQNEPFLANITLFDQDRLRYEGSHQSSAGGMGTFMYVHNQFYIKGDAAVARIARTDSLKDVSRTQMDDLLFTYGYSVELNERAGMTFSGLTGFPTHNDTGLILPQFGYAHYALGAQIDGDYAYSRHGNHSFRYAVRFLHFFPRSISLRAIDVNGCFSYKRGDFLDFLISHYSTFGNHGLEIGYSPEIFLNASLFPRRDILTQHLECTRHILYANYNYRFTIRDLPSAFGAGFSYGFENKSCPLNNKRILLGWISWGISF